MVTIGRRKSVLKRRNRRIRRENAGNAVYPTPTSLSPQTMAQLLLKTPKIAAKKIVLTLSQAVDASNAACAQATTKRTSA